MLSICSGQLNQALKLLSKIQLPIKLRGTEMKKIILVVMTIAGLAGATTAFAGDEGWYVLGGIGQVTNNSDKSTLDNALRSVGATGFSSNLSNPTVYELEAGYQVNKNFAIEGGYIASNDEKYGASGGNLAGPITASAHVTGWTLAAVGILPLANQFSILGKLGYAGIQLSGSVTGPGGTASLSGTKSDLTYGVGVKYDLTTAASMRLDLDSYNVGDSSSSSRSNVWTIRLGYKL